MLLAAYEHRERFYHVWDCATRRDAEQALAGKGQEPRWPGVFIRGDASPDVLRHHQAQEEGPDCVGLSVLQEKHGLRAAGFRRRTQLWGRSINHLRLNKLPKLVQPKIKANLLKNWIAETHEAAHQAFDRTLKRFGAKSPQAMILSWQRYSNCSRPTRNAGAGPSIFRSWSWLSATSSSRRASRLPINQTRMWPDGHPPGLTMTPCWPATCMWGDLSDRTQLENSEELGTLPSRLAEAIDCTQTNFL